MTKTKKVLFYDLEMFPGIYYGWSKFNPPFQQIAKTAINMISYKWAHRGKVQTIKLTKKQHKENPRQEKVLIEKFLKVMNEADIIIGHNGDKFDFKKFNARVMKYGLNPVKKPRMFDTLKMVKREAAFDSHRLGDLCTELDIPTKIETEKNLFVTAERDWEKYLDLVNYCEHDVIALEALYERIKPHSTPTFDFSGHNRACTSCGSVHIRKNGKYLLANGTEVARYRCNDCGSTKTRDAASGKTTVRAI